MVTATINYEKFTDCSKNDAGGLIDVINAGNSMYWADITVSDNAADGLIAIAIDAGNSTDCAEDAAGG